MSDAPTYDVAVVGGGPAGLTAALYTTRLGHRTAVLDGEGGRHESVARVHNLMGVSSETSGAALSQEAIDQFVVHGGDYYPDEVTGIERTDTDPLRFSLTAERADVTAFRIVLATGFVDEPPGVPGLDAFTGRGLHYCLHCDAYTLGDEPVYVLGHDDHAAAVAMMLLNLTGSVDLLLNGAEPTWCDDVGRQVSEHPLAVHEQAVVGTVPDEPTEGDRWLRGLRFSGDRVREYVGGFAVYGRRYTNDLAADLGCALDDDGAVAVDEDRRTSVDGVYAAGDLTHGQNQTPIAMGDGARAGIAVHKDLRPFPVPVDSLDAMPTAPAMADDLRARMRRLNEVGVDAGMRPDRPDGPEGPAG